MNRIGEAWIIHTFALLHALVALLCRIVGIEDELLLTILTMIMVLILCIKRNLNIELTAASIIVVNIIGWLMGNAGAKLFALFMESQYAVHAMATAMTTEILGWSLAVFSGLFHRSRKNETSLNSQYLSWLILAMGVIFILRLLIMLFLSKKTVTASQMAGMTSMIFTNTFALIILLCINIIYIWSGRRLLDSYPRSVKFICLVAFSLLAAFVEAALVGMAMPSFHLYVAALITQVTIYCLVYMVNYAITARAKMQEARGKANVAQYRYQILKRQVNPHFLFNSLNVLDCLVCDEKTEQASTYIHKLAGVYRYMIKSEDEQMVTVEEELTFVQMYVELMMVRFPDGFKVEIDADESLMKTLVLPCSMQLLIENAVKHNVISPTRPLVVRVKIDGDGITVTNNVIPKLTQVPSTGLGQKYIMKQYLDICGRAIEIRRTESEYCVVLPII